MMMTMTVNTLKCSICIQSELSSMSSMFSLGYLVVNTSFVGIQVVSVEAVMAWVSSLLKM